jgi:transposase
MPYPVIKHSYASPGAAAWVIHQKYELAVPLYRQEKECPKEQKSVRVSIL